MIIIIMFTFTTKSKYGLFALLEMAQNYGNPPLNVKEIAARRNISPQYLEQLLNRLIKPGLILAVRGQKGGFVLARPPREIALVDVLEALEGPLALSQNIAENDALLEYARQAEATLRRVLNVPLSDVLARQEARAVMFHI